MTAPAPAPSARAVVPLRRRLLAHLAQSQHRTAYYLALNNALGAATGFLFWLLLARFGGLRTGTLGIGYTVVAVGTIVGVLAKGGLDTALLRLAPGSSRAGGAKLLAFASGVGIVAAIALAVTFGVAATSLDLLRDLTPAAWAFAAGLASLLVVTWLQDAYFVAMDQARLSLERNLVLSAGRLLLPLPMIALAIAHPIPLTWAIALAASALAGTVRARRFPDRIGRLVPRREFLQSAAHNVSGGAAEFLPGLLLTPLVLALDGPVAAAYFGIAWTASQLVFQSSAAIGRSALAQMVRTGPAGHAAAIGRGVLEHAWLVAPLALAGVVFAPQFLAIFGPAYAAEGSRTLAVLCLSILFVAPASLYLAVLRARPRSLAAVAFPLAMILSLALWCPLLGVRYGLLGVALGWLLANVPFGLYATWGLLREHRGVMPRARAAPLDRRAELE